MSVGTLHHLPEILECGALSGLTVDVNGRREGGYESAIHGFMQDIGQNIESYHHIDYSTGWSGPRPCEWKWLDSAFS
ncbi:uncharacterized protein PHACADRAFT_257365 [Phanerochaete carnosa HHB-10118-sp]|uniref:Uncharacterized protein n=1 Tax=Phanerochaete carnosa (strain HHB-10118-sp) TaxID=650164 RepID=K5W439_PHACS|nr:uncharacterized protein PHACADRAFT_257365 [Phanerochaete carnosa HHB-10118-sp]EKM53885.1 hypothetical protein PHACADRAFT_257365 [Phanerochaete carnosa HHB-10118-sp]